MADKEYIERNALIAEYDRVHKGPAGGARKLMVEAPACDVAEVVHSNWQIHISEDGWEHHFCPICGEDAICECVYQPNYDEDLDGEWRYCGDIEVGISEHITSFCPNCGTRMDRESKED